MGGRPKQIRVTDLFEEVADEHAHRTAGMATATMDTPAAAGVRSRAGGGLPAVTCAVVAVCSGDGLAELFSNLGVQGVVTGGQTMNPSTAELLDTVEHVNADQVVILPNNKNIIPVAQQVDGAHLEDGGRGADQVDARGAGRARGLRPRGVGRGQRRRR